MAQTSEPDGAVWSSELRVLAGNALFGGVTAGVVALVRRESAGRAFVEGLVGGALIHGGKRIAVERWFGAGLAGRQVALLGGSIVGNAGAGRGTLDRIAIGFGPVRGYVDRRSAEVTWSLDVPAAAAAMRGIFDSAYRLDPDATLSSGALVFRAQDQSAGDGAAPGTIFYQHYSKSAERKAYVLAHERVHVLQFDQAYLFWDDPFEAWLGRRFRSLETPMQHLDFNLIGIGTAVLFGFLIWPEHGDQLWEKEAIYLAR